jgi:hypothetical protein
LTLKLLLKVKKTKKKKPQEQYFHKFSLFSETEYVQIYQHLALVPGELRDGPDDRGHQLPESIPAEEDRATSSCYKQSKRKVLLDQITTKLYQVAFSKLSYFFT